MFDLVKLDGQGASVLKHLATIGNKKNSPIDRLRAIRELDNLPASVLSTAGYPFLIVLSDACFGTVYDRGTANMVKTEAGELLNKTIKLMPLDDKIRAARECMQKAVWDFVRPEKQFVEPRFYEMGDSKVQAPNLSLLRSLVDDSPAIASPEFYQEVKEKGEKITEGLHFNRLPAIFVFALLLITPQHILEANRTRRLLEKRKPAEQGKTSPGLPSSQQLLSTAFPVLLL